MKARLGVNIDHVATLRQARGENYPSLEEACRLACMSDIEQITIHLREDRRHIQDSDLDPVKRVTQEFGKLLNLEIGASQEILEIAIRLYPDWICIVPENRQERTTEGGLNLIDESTFVKNKNIIKQIREKIPNTKISLFVQADLETLQKCSDLRVDAVEIHTGEYAKAFLDNKSVDEYIKTFSNCRDFAAQKKMGYHAGHGLTDRSLTPLVAKDLFEEYNIGHWIISDSIFNGLKKSIEKLTKIIKV